MRNDESIGLPCEIVEDLSKMLGFHWVEGWPHLAYWHGNGD